MSLVTDSTEPDTIAARFVDARTRGVALSGYPGVIPGSLSDAYVVQDRAIERVDGKVGGWKVGRIMPPLDSTWGSGRLAGPILERSIQRVQPESEAAASPIAGQIYVGGFGAAEAEFLFRLGAPPSMTVKDYSLDQAADLVDRVHIGIEIASSPLATINALGPPVIISDFGNNNGLIVGPEVDQWRSAGFADWRVEAVIDGVLVGQGAANAFPDGPLGSVRFLLELMAERGIRLEAGTWISTGAITGVHDVRVGQHVDVRFHAPTGIMRTQCTIVAA
jgi:2-keto-4-pentenoate hydratase